MFYVFVITKFQYKIIKKSQKSNILKAKNHKIPKIFTEKKLKCSNLLKLSVKKIGK